MTAYLLVRHVVFKCLLSIKENVTVVCIIWHFPTPTEKWETVCLEFSKVMVHSEYIGISKKYYVYIKTEKYIKIKLYY